MQDNYIFPVAPVPTLSIAGSDRLLPVHRVFCVGRNYRAHAEEMGATVDKASQEPIYFQKHPAAIVHSGATIPYARGTSDLQHEIELVVAIGGKGCDVPEARAQELVFGYACGLDMTRRDLQAKAKQHGNPWDLSKNFEQSAVLSPVVDVTRSGPIEAGRIELAVNGETRQTSDIGRMIWSIPEIISHLSRFYRLVPGDLIFTGTPEGVGPVLPGDRLVGRIDGVGDIGVRFEAAA